MQLSRNRFTQFRRSPGRPDGSPEVIREVKHAFQSAREKLLRSSVGVSSLGLDSSVPPRHISARRVLAEESLIRAHMVCAISQF
jgi:hypothetical protein